MFDRHAFVLPAVLAVLLAGCATPSQAPVATPTAAPAGWRLGIVHINDHHSHLEPQRDMALKLDGQSLSVDVGGMARVATLVRERVVRGGPVLKIHAGDATPGTLFGTVFEGQADADVMNAICFDTFTLGNHEFDAGDKGLANFLATLGRQSKCRTFVLSANVQPQVGTPLLPTAGQAMHAPWVIKTLDGVRVGIVGVTVSQKTVVSSRPLPSTRFDDELSAARQAIAQLQGAGVQHIVVASHLGHGNEKLLASRLPGVDVVVGGDSHTLLGDGLASYGLPAQGAYPAVVKNADGDTVCIVQAWEYSKAVGLLDVQFDAAGRVSGCGGQAVVPLGENFKADRKPVDAATGETLRQRFSGSHALRIVMPDPEVDALVRGYRQKLDIAMSGRIGDAPSGLCHVRVPGAASSPSCGPRGSDTAQWVAQAFLDASRRADIALQNAGGVRSNVPAGVVTFDTAFKVLPFANTLVELDMTGAEVRQALEDGVANWFDPAANGFRGSDGSHPYAAGLRWDLNLDAPRGSRFSNLAVRNRSTGDWTALDPARRYVVVTNDFIASGRDGYATLGRVSAERGRAVDTGLYYTQTFVEAIRRAGSMSPMPPDNYSNQNVTASRPLPTRQ